MKLGIIIPSNDPLEYSTHVTSSLAHLRDGLEDHEIKILLTGQPPWDSVLAYRASKQAKQFDIDLRFRIVPQETPPRMCSLRASSAALWPEADVYMLADSNMRWMPARRDGEISIEKSSGERYWEVLHYMESFPRCGLVQCHTSDPLDMYSTIAPTSNGLVTTNKGLFLRNIYHGGIWPLETLTFKASLEETVAGYYILESGYFPARQYQNPTFHKIHKINYDTTLHSGVIIDQNAGKWIRERYDAPEWEHESERFPDKLIAMSIRNGDPNVSFSHNDTAFRITY